MAQDVAAWHISWRGRTPNGRKANLRIKSALRRALTRGAVAESFDPHEIYERDGWICRLCAGPVLRAAKWPAPLSPSIDHIVPLALGGAHTRANVQLAHHRCNMRKGASLCASPPAELETVLSLDR